MTVGSATYGANCGAPASNMLSQVRASCSAKTGCSFTPLGLIGDPAPGCAKTAGVTYHCAAGTEKSQNAAAEAGYTTFALACP